MSRVASAPPPPAPAGYAYAIKSTSAVVLAALQQRCQTAGGRDVGTRCQFVL